jgi:3-hydroxyacyl-[acyl-carrier-protein] dehydratase
MTVRDSITAARMSGPQSQAGDMSSLEFRFKAEDPTFAGHFPTRPILPGVFQLETARMAAEWVLNCSLVLREIRKAKFLRPILPGEIVRVELKLSEKDNIIEARAVFSVGGQPAGETHLLLCRSE